MKFLSKFFQEIGEHGTRTVVKYGTIMIADTLKRYIRLQHIIFTFITVHKFIETVHNSIPLMLLLNSFFSCNVRVAFGSRSHNCTPL